MMFLLLAMSTYTHDILQIMVELNGLNFIIKKGYMKTRNQKLILKIFKGYV